MGNYKDKVGAIESLIDRGKPFLIVKYSTVFLDRANNAYDIVTLGSNKLYYMPIDRKDALEAISKFDIPLLHYVDSRNQIWGDRRFKEEFNRKGIKL